MSAIAAEFASRFALAACARDGVLLDLQTGEYYRVDASGVAVARALAKYGDEDAAAGALARLFAIERASAKADIAALLDRMPSKRPRTRAKPVSFVARRAGFAMLFHGERALYVDAASRRITRAVVDARTLRVAAPHVLALASRIVLHASAAVLRGQVVAFVGPSGIGKTTIARMLERRGVRIVSRDLVVLDAAFRVVAEGEPAIVAWSRTRARSVGDIPLPARSLPLGKVCIVERAPVSSVEIERLRGADAIAALFANAFIELPDRGVWRAALASCEALEKRGLVHRARVPDRLPKLRRAIAELKAWQ